MPDELKEQLAEQAAPAPAESAPTSSRSRSRRPARSAAARCSSAAATAASSSAAPSIPSARAPASPARRPWRRSPPSWGVNPVEGGLSGSTRWRWWLISSSVLASCLKGTMRVARDPGDRLVGLFLAVSVAESKVTRWMRWATSTPRRGSSHKVYAHLQRRFWRFFLGMLAALVVFGGPILSIRRRTASRR